MTRAVSPSDFNQLDPTSTSRYTGDRSMYSRLCSGFFPKPETRFIERDASLKPRKSGESVRTGNAPTPTPPRPPQREVSRRSEEHTSELQSRGQIVCRLLLDS